MRLDGRRSSPELFTMKCLRNETRWLGAAKLMQWSQVSRNALIRRGTNGSVGGASPFMGWGPCPR